MGGYAYICVIFIGSAVKAQDKCTGRSLFTRTGHKKIEWIDWDSERGKKGNPRGTQRYLYLSTLQATE